MSKIAFFSDAIHVIIQPTRQTETAEMVRGSSRQAEEKDHSRIDYYSASQEAQDVFILRMERCQNCVQKVGDTNVQALYDVIDIKKKTSKAFFPNNIHIILLDIVFCISYTQNTKGRSIKNPVVC